MIDIQSLTALYDMLRDEYGLSSAESLPIISAVGLKLTASAIDLSANLTSVIISAVSERMPLRPTKPKRADETEEKDQMQTRIMRMFTSGSVRHTGLNAFSSAVTYY